MPTADPPFRLLIATPQRLGHRYSAALSALCAALIARGVTPILLQGWDGAGYVSVERSLADDGTILYRSTRPQADLGTLALMEAPDAAVLLGPEALGCAPVLVAADIPTLLRQEGDHPVDFGPLETLRLLRRAAATGAEADRLAALTRDTLVTLPFPAPDPSPYRSGGAGVLILSDRPADGILLSLALAEARPDLTFFLPPASQRAGWLQERLQRQPNLRALLPGTKPPPLAAALLPQGSGGPPWADLAGLLAAGIPVLGGDLPLLAAAIGPAGRCRPLTAPLGDWLAALAALIGGDRPDPAVCRAQADRLMPAAAAAAALWSDALRAHAARCRALRAGQV